MAHDTAQSSQSFWHGLARPISILAPMEGVTDLAFRDIMWRAGRPMVFVSEFTSANVVLRGRAESQLRLAFNEKHRPMVAQIWGNNPEDYYNAVRELHRRGFDGVDINMGCPTRKIVSKGACSALIDNRSLAAELIRAAREGAESAFSSYGDSHEGPPGRIQSGGHIPISVKTRIGFKNVCSEEWCGFLLEQGIQLLSIHGRTAVQQSEGKADWEEIARVVKLRNAIAPRVLIIGNGDITEYGHISEYHRRYRVDGVMVGRGVLENIFFFRNEIFHSASVDRKITWALDHVRTHLDHYGTKKSFDSMKKFFKIYINQFEGAEELRDSIMNVHLHAEAERMLRQFQRSVCEKSARADSVPEEG